VCATPPTPEKEVKPGTAGNVQRRKAPVATTTCSNARSPVGVRTSQRRLPAPRSSPTTGVRTWIRDVNENRSA
jgi:hypothetical protein